MSKTTEKPHAPSPSDRELVFHLGLTFVLVPKKKTNGSTLESLQRALSKLDSQATTTKDPRSKNYWLRASTGHNAEKIAKLAKAKADLGDFTVRGIVSGSPEERRIQHHIIESLGLTTDTPNDGTGSTSRDNPTGTNANESQQNFATEQSHQDRSPTTTKPELEEPWVSTSNSTSLVRDEKHGVMTTRRSSRHQKAEAPPPPSSLDEEPLSNRSRGKRTATSAFSNPDRVPATGSSRPAFPKISTVERPQKRVKFNLDLNTFKFCEGWDNLEPLVSSSNTRGALTTAPTVKDLPSTCLRSIFIYGTPDPTITSAKTYRSTLYGFMAVCTKWKSAAESTPSLWSHLSNANPPEMLDACIQRSSGAAITVHFDGSMEYPSSVQSAFDRFVDKVAPHRLRWGSLRFNDVPPTWSSYLAIARAFGGPAPALKSAEVTTIHGTTMPFVHHLRCFSGDAGTLRHIALTGIVPKLGDLSIFANVETLRVIRPMGICPAYLLRILARNNKLRSLELVDVRPSYAHLFQNIETLELPDLLQFKLHLLGENTVEMAQLFTRLRAPKCRQLDLAIDMDNLNALNLVFNTLEFDLEAFLRILGAWMSKWIVLDCTRSVYRWVDPTPTGISNKPILHWQYGGAVDGTYRGLSADVRLGVESRRTKTIILKWVEDVKLHAGLVEAALKRGVSSAQMESFQSYRQRLINWRREREDVEDDINPTNLWPA